MKRCVAWILVLACVLCLLPVDAQATDMFAGIREVLRERTYYFWFWEDCEGKCYTQSRRVDGGVDISVKMENRSAWETVDAYTFEISALNVYEEPIQIKHTDGRYYDSLLYTGDKTFGEESSGYTEYFAVRAREKISYVVIKLVKYHTDNGTKEVDESYQTEYTWKIE